MGEDALKNAAAAVKPEPAETKQQATKTDTSPTYATKKP